MQAGARRGAPRVAATIAAFAGLLLVAALVLLNNDAWLRALIEHEVAARTGRTLQISGDFRVDWSLTPRIHAEKVTLDNAPWGSHPTMLEVERVDCNVSLFDFLLGDLVLPEVALSRPWALLEFNSEGERNWILERRQKRTDDPPRIVRLTIDSGKIRYRNPTANTDVALDLATVESAPEAARTRIDAKGVFRGLKASAVGTGGAVLSLRDESLRYPLDIKLEIGSTRASARGEVSGLVTLSKVNLDTRLQGPGLRELGKIIEIPLPDTAKYWVAGNLSRDGDSWRFVAFKGVLGKSDLAGEFAFDRQGERPFVHANVTSKQLVIDDLPLNAKDDSRPAKLKRLRDFDADIKLDAKSVRVKERVVGDLSARLKLAGGELQFDPLKLQLGGGRINATALVDARTEPPQMNIGMTMSELQLEKLFRRTRGTAAGSANVVSSGSSFADIVANSNGEVRFVVSEGEISNLLVSYMGLDAAGLFSSLIGDSNVPVNCAIGDFALKGGVLHTQALVIDTTKSDIAGSGTINLAKRTWDLTFSPLMEEGILSGLISDGAPVHVGGTFKNPEFSADTSGVAVRAGAAVALGIINPLAALIPLLPSAADKEANCAQLVEATHARGMSPKN
jgi:uncharacterized protein involved in outer membrane biogenesis